ncbi:ETC complex I subunit conserved region-domain-containing protein [Pilobolus umbonatus]|nr:ETC complex I subunit conserved region-domain-containing protein [Pilobolus umbonatus]
MSLLISKTAALSRSSLAKSAILGVRFNSQSTKDVIHLEQLPVASVENLSGAPESLLDRNVRIFQPARTAAQQGKNGTRLWRIDFDILEDGNRWENPVMGWSSSSDFQQALTMKFMSKEDAIRFAEKQGWNYYVQEPKKPKFVKKVYAENFAYTPNKLRKFFTK